MAARRPSSLSLSLPVTCTSGREIRRRRDAIYLLGKGDSNNVAHDRSRRDTASHRCSSARRINRIVKSRARAGREEKGKDLNWHAVNARLTFERQIFTVWPDEPQDGTPIERFIRLLSLRRLAKRRREERDAVSRPRSGPFVFSLRSSTVVGYQRASSRSRTHEILPTSRAGRLPFTRHSARRFSARRGVPSADERRGEESFITRTSASGDTALRVSRRPDKRDG